MNLYIDIETGPLPIEQRAFTKPTTETVKYGNTKDEAKCRVIFEKAVTDWEAGNGAALDAITGRVLMVGIAEGDKPYLSYTHESEADIIDDAMCMMDGADLIYGHDIIRFDVPFLMRRAMILGVDVPEKLKLEISKYAPVYLIDTMRRWTFGVRNEYISLEWLCGAFGITVKDSPVTGATFAEWFEKDREAAIRYNQQDVEAVRKLAKRMGMVSNPSENIF